MYTEKSHDCLALKSDMFNFLRFPVVYVTFKGRLLKPIFSKVEHSEGEGRYCLNKKWKVYISYFILHFLFNFMS